MTSFVHKRLWIGFISSIVIITWLAIASYSNNRKSAESARWVAHTNRVLYHSEQILASVVDVESGQRGYALTGLQEFLKPMLRSVGLLHEHLNSLKRLTNDNASQQDRISTLEKLLDHKVNFAKRAIELRRREGLAKVIALHSSLEGKQMMDRIRSLILRIQEEEHVLLKQRTDQINTRVAKFNASFVGMLVVTGIIIAIVCYMVFVNLKARAAAENSLRIASEKIQDMYENAPCGYYSINADGTFVEVNNTWLQWLRLNRADVVGKMKFQDLLTAKGIGFFNETFLRFKKEGSLRDAPFDILRSDGTTFSILLNSVAIFDTNGNFIKSRSTAIDYTDQKKAMEKIEQLNQELESFSYSVSHDLRAPLRSIDGYTQILLEDYAHKLDDEGKRVLNVVVNNARRMAALIDDLLDFSRIGRKELTKSVVNTENMVQSVLSELTSMESARVIETTVHPLDPCDGDPNLLRQVWVNLISNALKYTRKRSKAEIEISSYKNASDIIYKVKDNGTGFDMQYAHKLFGVFQRLHRQQEFEGTGVGLAIVQRIISRHGGRVWAEAEVDKGAAFYFSLPTIDNTTQLFHE